MCCEYFVRDKLQYVRFLLYTSRQMWERSSASEIYAIAPASCMPDQLPTMAVTTAMVPDGQEDLHNEVAKLQASYSNRYRYYKYTCTSLAWYAPDAAEPSGNRTKCLFQEAKILVEIFSPLMASGKLSKNNPLYNMYVCIYIYMYVCMCVCLCILVCMYLCDSDSLIKCPLYVMIVDPTFID